MSEHPINELPALSVVKPRQKHCLQGDECKLFEDCIRHNEKNDIVVTHLNGVPNSYILDNVLTNEECQLLCKEVDDHPALSFWCQGKEEDSETRSFRNVKTIELFSHTLAELMWKRIERIVNEVLDVVIDNEDSDDYERELEGTWIATGLNPDCLFARYPSHGSFAPHTDGRAIVNFNNRSHYSVIVYLNDIPLGEGGGTRFYEKSAVSNLKKRATGEQEVWTSDASLVIGEVEAIAGRMLIFYQPFVHEGVPPVAPHMKYIIRSDIISTRTPAICDSPGDQEAYRIFKQGENLVESGNVEEGVKLFRKAFKLSPLMAQIMGQA